MIKAPANIADASTYTIAKCINELIINRDFDEALNNLLKWLDASYDIDSCYIFKVAADTAAPFLYKSFRTEHSFPNQEDLQQFFDHTTLKDVSEIRELLERRNSVKASINNHLSAAFKELMQTAMLRSMFLTPIFTAGNVSGIVAFGDSKNTRTWRNNEQDLQSLATAIGVSLQNHSPLPEQVEHSETVNEEAFHIKEFTWQLDLRSNQVKVEGGNNANVPAQARDMLTAFKEKVHPEDAERVMKKFREIISIGHEITDEDVFRLWNEGSQSYEWVKSKRKLVCDEEGRPVTVLGVTRDINHSHEVSFAFNQQKEQLNFLVQRLGQVIFQLDGDANVISVSNTWRQLSGYDENETIGTSFYRYFKDSLQKTGHSFSFLVSGLTDTVDLQLPFLKKNGKLMWVRLLAKNIKDVSGKLSGIFGSLENINEKYTTDLLLRESNEKLNTILNSSKEIILTINLDENIVENVNEAIGILGYKPEEWIGMSYRTWSAAQRYNFQELMKLALKNDLQVNNYRITFGNKDNTEQIPFEFSTSIFSFKKSKYLLCVLRDIRERLEYEKNLQSMSSQLSHLINNIDDVYAIYNLGTSTYEFVSDNICKLYDCTKLQFIDQGLTWVDIIHPQDVSGVLKQVQEIIEKKQKGEFFYRIISPKGEQKTLLEKIIVGKDKEGRADKLYIVITDYTHIENAEQSLIETERKFKFISENISDFISIHDPDWNFTYASPSIRNILGYEPEEIVGRGGFDFVHPEDVIRTLDQALEPLIIEKKETQFRYRMKAKNGEFKWVESYSKPVTDAAGETSSIISSTRDVTDQVNAETMLKTSEERYRLLSENSNDVIAILNLQGEVAYVSPSSTPVLGYTPQELTGKNPVHIFTRSEMSRLIATEGLRSMINEKEGRKFIEKVFTKNGQVKCLEVWVQPIVKNDEVVSFQAASRDVTEREKLLDELEQSLAKERELNELRSLFVSTASHQFRTPLTVIQSGVEIMEMYLEDLPDEKQQRFQKQFLKIQAEVQRLQYLMSDILLLGRANAARTPFVPETNDLVEFCRNIIEEKYNNVHEESRKVLLTVQGKNKPVDFDSKLIGHAVENLLNNAYKYSFEGNLLMDIAFGEEEVKIDISDNGIGIPEEDQKNLFQPFYRATNTSEIEGTGLGLAVIKEFVDKHSGKIFITSILNKGTTISVILPVKQKQ